MYTHTHTHIHTYIHIYVHTYIHLWGPQTYYVRGLRVDGGSRKSYATLYKGAWPIVFVLRRVGGHFGRLISKSYVICLWSLVSIHTYIFVYIHLCVYFRLTCFQFNSQVKSDATQQFEDYKASPVVKNVRTRQRPWVETVWVETVASRRGKMHMVEKTANSICPLRLAMGTPLFQFRRCVKSGTLPCMNVDFFLTIFFWPIYTARSVNYELKTGFDFFFFVCFWHAQAVIASNNKLPPNFEYIEELRKSKKRSQSKAMSVDQGSKKVLVLGAGYVASPVVEYLSRDSHVRITVGKTNFWFYRALKFLCWNLNRKFIVFLHSKRYQPINQSIDRTIIN